MSDRHHLLVVEDDRDLSELLSYNLSRAGYEVSVASTGKKALDMIATRHPDLILLDIMLPEVSGTDIARFVRSTPATAWIPIIYLTAKGTESDQIAGLAGGADDYIAKPFSMKVVIARIEALLRRAVRSQAADRSLVMGRVRIDFDTHEVFVAGEEAKLTLTEFRLLAALLQAGGRVLSRGALIDRAMGPGVAVTERTIDVHLTAVRRKLGDQAGLIKTVRGLGYRATPELESGAGAETTGETR